MERGGILDYQFKPNKKEIEYHYFVRINEMKRVLKKHREIYFRTQCMIFL